MKQNLIMDIVQGMLPYLNNAQTQRLQEVLQHTLFDYEVAKTESDEGLSEQNLVELFLSAKRIEGCSEKTLKYYKATIQAMIDSIGKGIKYIVTDDIRCCYAGVFTDALAYSKNLQCNTKYKFVHRTKNKGGS